MTLHPRKGFAQRVTSRRNALEFCVGTIAEMADGDVYDAVETYSRQQKLASVHLRNVHGKAPFYKETFIDDGDVDVLIMNVDEPPSLLRNDAPAGHNWLKIRLEGTKSNRSAIGARAVVRYGGKIQVQEVTSGTSFFSSNDPRLHFGLGANAKADVRVRWPDGKSESFVGLAANQLVTIREGQGIVKGRGFR